MRQVPKSRRPDLGIRVAKAEIDLSDHAKRGVLIEARFYKRAASLGEA